MITLGGDAELELVDSLDPFSEGIVFRLVRLHLFNKYCHLRPRKIKIQLAVRQNVLNIATVSPA